jgi:hypothetical protein
MIHSPSLSDHKVPTIAANLQSKVAGSLICQRMETVLITAIALHKFAQFSVNHGGQFICAATTVIAGLNCLYQGNIWTGPALTAIGSKQLYNLMYGNKSDVQRLLQDASAGIDMIKTLEQANAQSFENVEGNLTLVSQNMLDLQSRLQDIRCIATQGSQKLEEQKKITLALYQEADELFKKTQLSLNQSKEKINASNEQFAEALNQIGELVQLAQKEGGDFKEKTDHFKQLAEQIYNECTAAKGTLEKGNQSLNEGILVLNEALNKYQQATFEAGKTSEMAKAEFEKIRERAEIEKNGQAQIDEIREELNDVKARNKDMHAIADEVQNDIEEAQRVAGDQFGYQSIILGGGFGAAAGAFFSGGVGAYAGAVGGTVTYHNREKLGNLFLGKDPEPVPAKPTILEPVTFKFNERSSGFWGRYIEKRASFTVGKLAIDLGNNESMTLDFNLNAKHKIARKDVNKLCEILARKLKNDPNFAQTCSAILKKLEKMTIDRSTYHKPTTGFIATNDPYFANLKRDLEKKLAETPKKNA